MGKTFRTIVFATNSSPPLIWRDFTIFKTEQLQYVINDWVTWSINVLSWQERKQFSAKLHEGTLAHNNHFQSLNKLQDESKGLSLISLRSCVPKGQWKWGGDNQHLRGVVDNLLQVVITLAKNSHCWPLLSFITSLFFINMSNPIPSSVQTSQGTHLRHHFMGHKSLDGSQTELGDLWLFGATAHQERLNHLRAVLLQSCRNKIKILVTIFHTG